MYAFYNLLECSSNFFFGEISQIWCSTDLMSIVNRVKPLVQPLGEIHEMPNLKMVDREKEIARFSKSVRTLMVFFVCIYVP